MRTRDSATIRISRSLAFVAGIALVAASCGGSTESGIEKLIEQQGGGTADLDFDDGFSIQTEEGGMTIDEDGNFVITGKDGEVITGNADDEGNFSIEGDDGTITGNEEDGEFNVEGEDGSLTISSGSEMPSEWPSDVPPPDEFLITTSSVIGTGDDLLVSLVGTSTEDAPDFIEDYGDTLVSAGFEQTSSFESEGSVLRVYTNDSWDVSVTAIDGIEEDVQISINLIQSV